MSTRGQFNTRNPTIKRILKEAAELSSTPSPDYHAEPLESNLFEWHFTIRGPPSSPYAAGMYHGRIVLPPQYPLRPPMFRFLTPTGRFEVNREICLSISGHHEETWQPAWGVRTALVAIRSFMVENVKGQLGGIETTDAARRRFAGESTAWKCATCQQSNADIIKEREELAKETGEGPREDEIPEELRLAYRDELTSGKKGAREDKAGDAESSSVAQKTGAASSISPAAAPASSPARPIVASLPTPTRTIPQPLVQQSPDRSLAWIDACIYGIIAALLFMILRKAAA